MRAAFSGNTVSHHPTGKQVNDNTEVHGVVLDFEICTSCKACLRQCDSFDWQQELIVHFCRTIQPAF